MEVENTKYITPITTLTKAQETMKVINLGRGTFGVRFRRDMNIALELKRGELLFVTLERPPVKICHHCNNSL